MLKVSRGLSPEIIDEIFQFRDKITYDWRQRSQFYIPSVYSVFSGTETIKFLGLKIWALVSYEMKQLESLGKFRKEIKQGKPTVCPCKLCKRYNHRIGFL